MSERTEGRSARPGSRRLVSVVLFVLAAVLIIVSICGFVLRGSASSKANLDKMRTSAVLHAATGGLVDNIAQQARAEKLKELRADKNFRKRGLDEVNSICDEAMNAAREEAEKLYSNPVVEDEAGLRAAIEAMEGVLANTGSLQTRERETYAGIYRALADNISDWTGIAGEGTDDAAVLAALSQTAPALNDEGNAHLRDGFVKLARDMAASQQAKQDAELQEQLTAMMTGTIADWTE